MNATATSPARNIGRYGSKAEVVTVGGQDFASYTDGLQKLCARCSGTGTLPEYLGIFAGVCFDCNGIGVNRKVYGGIPAIEKAQAAAAKRAAAAQAKRTAAWEAGAPARLAAEIVDAERAAYAEAARLAGIAASRYAGEVGAKVSVTGTVAVSLYLEPQQYGWSASRMVVVEGTGEFAGITVKTVSAGQALYGLQRGDVVTISGTVKDHAVYEGKSQTVVTRPKVEVISKQEEA